MAKTKGKSRAGRRRTMDDMQRRMVESLRSSMKGTWSPISHQEYLEEWIPAYNAIASGRFARRPGSDAKFAFQFPGPKNVHIDRELTGFAVDFARDRNLFAVETICPAVTVPNMSDKFFRFDSPDSFRIVNEEYDLFAPGNDGGEPRQMPMKFDVDTFECVHRALSYNLGNDVERNADFPVRAKFTQHLVAALNTFKLNRALALLTDANVITNTDDAADLSGGQFDTATEANPYIQHTIDVVARTMAKNSFNSLDPNQIFMVINPNTAANMGRSAEIKTYLKNNPQAPLVLQGMDPVSGQRVGGKYNIPSNLYGINVLVIEAIKRTSEEGAASAVDAFVMPDDKAVFIHRDAPGMASFSTLTCFEFMPFAVMSFTIAHEWRDSLQVHNSYAIKATAPASGYLVTDVLSASASTV